jgi:hypothetical protein
LFGLVAAAAIAIAGVGCSADKLPPPPSGQGGQPSSGSGPGSSGTGAGPVTTSNALSGSCALEGEVRECHMLIGQHAGITNCFYGTQRCEWGGWTECRDGEYAIKSVVRSGPPITSEPRSLDALTEAGLDPARVGPAQTPELVPGANGELAQVESTAKATCNDPCDPTCQKITESGAYTVNGQSLSGWAMATFSTLGGAQSGLQTAGLWPATCYTASDCEFGMFCQNPATKNLGTGAGQCTHDKCAVGPALDKNCGDPCVAAVCAANPNCCIYTGACTPHGPCATGDVLTCQASDPAVAQVCADPSFAYCCDTANPTNPGWDAGCVNAYGTYSGVACPADPARAWNSVDIDPNVGVMACTQLVHDVCGLDCPDNAPNCDHDLCLIGSGLTAGCDPKGCVTAVCAANASCCGPTNTWSQACIDALPVACGQACPGNVGVCSKYLPNQVDPECTGADLVAGVPCYDTVTNPTVTVPTNTTCTNDASCNASTTSGLVCQTPGQKSCIAGCRGTGGNGCPTGYTCSSTTSAIGTCYASKVPGNTTTQGFVVLCNVGTQPTPVNTPVAVNVYANGSTPTSWPASPPAGATRSCSTATIGNPQILPGKCIDVPCVTNPNDGVYVNPPNPVAPYAGTAQVAECTQANNWSLNLDPSTSNRVQCDAPACSLQNGLVRSLSSHIVIEAENSSIMPAGEWLGIRAGIAANLTNFASGAPWTSANIYADVGYFPDSATNCTATGAGACGAAPNCVKTSPGMAQTAGSNITNLSNALIGTVPLPGNPPPYITALQGALETAKADVQGTLPLTPTPTAGTQWTTAVALILGSDLTAAGNNYCGSNVTAMSGIAAQYYAKYNIRTFVVAVGPAKFATANAIATAGGGMAFYVANDVNLTSNLDKALRKIEAYSDQACSFPLPPVSLFDPTSTQGRIFSPNAPNTTTPNYRYLAFTPITQVTPVANWSSTYNTYLEACLANCPALTAPGGASTSGWCYDDPNTPSRMYLCENTCDAVLFDTYLNNTISAAAPPAGNNPHGQITYMLACPSYFANNNYPTPGAYVGDFCDNIPGSKPLWSYLGWNTVNAVDTSVTFSFQTADRVNGVCPAISSFPAPIRAQCDATHPCQSPLTCSGGVCSGTYTVTATQANQVCQLGTAGCPIDLVNGMQLGRLSGPLNADCLNLTVALNPNPQHTNTPTVNSFELRYSCPYTE